MNAFKRLWNSTAALYERFGLDAETTPPSKRRRIFMEEVAELLEESMLDEVATWSAARREYELASEAADVVVTVIGLLQAHGISLEQFQVCIDTIARKNDAKTHDTHALVNGKITRKAG